MALAAQGFAKARPATVSTRHLTATAQRMGVTQIDSVNVFARSHYMPFFARLGEYDPDTLDRLAFGARGPYVEFWAHCAALIPIDDWPLWQFRMSDHRAKYGAAGSWLAQHADTEAWVRSELAERGPLRAAEIEQDVAKSPRGPWWDWNDVKRVLELLWLTGDVAIAGRRGFERRYALAENVIPADALNREVSRADAVRELVCRAARASGVATTADLDDYYRFRNQKEVAIAISELVDLGELSPVVVRGWQRGNAPLPAWVHKDARLPRRIGATAILSPFDPVVWFRGRAERLFDFDYRIEIYTPAHKRLFGYYSLPVLVGDAVVGRLDLKADRASSTLLVQSAWWQQNRPAGAADRVATELLTAARWQGLEHVSVSSWGNASDDLAGALPGCRRHERVAPQPLLIENEEP